MLPLVLVLLAISSGCVRESTIGLEECQVLKVDRSRESITEPGVVHYVQPYDVIDMVEVS